MSRNRTEGGCVKSGREENGVIPTAGVVFPDARALELIVDRSSNKARLLDYRAGGVSIRDRVKVGGRTYTPLPLTPAILRAVCFPQRAEGYGKLEKLFGRVTALISENFAPLERDVRLIAHWQLATWFADVLPVVPSLVISSTSAARISALFRLLRCGCRHGVRLAGLSSAVLRALPMGLHPTLFLDQARRSPTMREFLHASSDSGVFVIHFGGVENLRCATALVASEEDDTATEVVRVTLPPEDSRSPLLTEQQLAEITGELQPILLDYRLRNIRAVSQSNFDAPGLTTEFRSVARSLGAAVVGDPQLALGIVSLLASQDTDARARLASLPETAVVTVALALLHEGKFQKIFTADFAGLVNTALRANGEILEYSAEEVGWLLNRLGLFTRSIGGRRGLRFDREFSRNVHELAPRYGIRFLPASFPKCLDCQLSMQTADFNRVTEGQDVHDGSLYKSLEGSDANH